MSSTARPTASATSSRIFEPGVVSTHRPPAHIQPLTPRPFNSNVNRNRTPNTLNNLINKNQSDKKNLLDISFGNEITNHNIAVNSPKILNSGDESDIHNNESTIFDKPNPRTNGLNEDDHLTRLNNVKQEQIFTQNNLKPTLRPQLKHNWDAHLKLSDVGLQSTTTSAENDDSMLVAAKLFFPLHAVMSSSIGIGRSFGSTNTNASSRKAQGIESQNPHRITISKSKSVVLNPITNKNLGNWNSFNKIQQSENIDSHFVPDKRHSIDTFENTNRESIARKVPSSRNSEATEVLPRRGKSLGAFGYSSTSSYVLPPGRGGTLGQTFHVNTGSARSSFTIYG